MLKQGGGQVVDATQEQRDAWRKAMEPVYPQIVKETGGDAAGVLCRDGSRPQGLRQVTTQFAPAPAGARWVVDTWHRLECLIAVAPSASSRWC